MGDELYEPLVAYILTVDKAGFGILVTSALCFATALLVFLWGRFSWKGRMVLFFGGFLVAAFVGALGVYLGSSKLVFRLETVTFG